MDMHLISAKALTEMQMKGNVLLNHRILRTLPHANEALLGAKIDGMEEIELTSCLGVNPYSIDVWDKLMEEFENGGYETRICKGEKEDGRTYVKSAHVKLP